jgi:Phosphotransferase enzyme family
MTVRSPYPLPLTIEAVTPSWIEAALRHGRPGVGLNGAELVDVQHGTCTKLRFRLDPDVAGRAAGIPELVIVKGGFEPHSRMMHYMHGHEVHAYADVAPLSPLRSPACWFAGYDEQGQQGIVVLDDLVARGVEFCHTQRPLTPDAVAGRLEVLARHHALAWGDPGRLFPWATGYVEGFDRYGAELLTPEVWGQFTASARGAAASVRFHDLDWMRRALRQLVRLSDQQPRTLLHGDTHLGNLYVDIDGVPGFFDSQPHHGPAMCEVAYHITGALDPADRRGQERALVALYRDALRASRVEPPPLEEMMRQYGCLLAVGYCVFLVNASDFQPEAINTAYTARFSQAMLDHDTIALIEAI